MNLECRYLPANDLELRAQSARELPRIVGYAAVFNSLSEEIADFRERILPGAFAESIRDGSDIVARVEHKGAILGRTRSRSLRLSEDSKGLRFEIDPPNTSAARDLIEMIRRGDLRGSSFGFKVRPGGERWTYSGGRIRELLNVRLLDIAPAVIEPAYSATNVSLLRGGEQPAVLEMMRMRLGLAERS